MQSNSIFVSISSRKRSHLNATIVKSAFLIKQPLRIIGLAFTQSVSFFVFSAFCSFPRNLRDVKRLTLFFIYKSLYRKGSCVVLRVESALDRTKIFKDILRSTLKVMQTSLMHVEPVPTQVQNLISGFCLTRLVISLMLFSYPQTLNLETTMFRLLFSIRMAERTNCQRNRAQWLVRNWR